MMMSGVDDVFGYQPVKRNRVRAYIPGPVWPTKSVGEARSSPRLLVSWGEAAGVSEDDPPRSQGTHLTSAWGLLQHVKSCRFGVGPG